jgi:Na+/H+ antiporter NhaD/arsenite permease-like protein
MGVVYMGALTYIGNAPNRVARSIAHERGIGMPNFFAYMLWAGLILVPVLALLTVLAVSPILNLR